MADDAYLIDTNILLRWVKPDDVHYRLVNAAIDHLIEQRSRLCYTSQNLAEFWNTCTRPADRNGYGLTIEEADGRATLIENTLNLLADNAAIHREWRALIVANRVSGTQVHDARLVAAIRVHQVNRILTFNGRDFARYTTVEAFHPGELLNRPA